MIQEAVLTWRYVDTESNLILPWYTKPALEWLKSQDVSNWRVFEYGCGYSTMWWSLNCKWITAVDTNEGWARAVGVIHYPDKESYVKSIEWQTEERYDCIVVDGEWREECVAFSRDTINPGGYMIVDNYGQTDFPPAEKIDALLEGWTKVVYKQPNHSDWSTAVFQKS